VIGWKFKAVNIDRFAALVERSPETARQAAVLSINDTARRTRTNAKKEILKQVAFGASYLGNAETGRLRVNQWASTGKLESSIVGRFQPTSLAHFVTNTSTLMQKGAPGTISAGRGTARLRIKPGNVTSIDKAYLLRLKNNNIGLAIRPGKRGVMGSSKQYPIGNTGWYLLYGPSVNQVFMTVKDDLAPSTSLFLEKEFIRQFERLNKDG